ncbi:TIGR00268 family protein, partial [Bacteroidota bacterium]
LQAAAKYEVLSPMVDCSLTKDELRQIARHFELPNWDKPASPCLSSRIPYHHSITREKLRQVEDAENILNEFGFNDVRVRHYGNYGQIEVQKEELEKLLIVEDEVINKIKTLGFEDLKIDKEGLVSGKLNRVLNNK